MSVATRQNDYYYTVLNLPPSASENEIRERYRALSVVFHPDKQHDERAKETASKKFLEIQKAYEVLSDPFLRAVYDVLGEEGISQEWSEDWRLRPIDEVRRDLKRAWINLEQERIDKIVRVRGTVTCGINATTLFDDDPEYYSSQLFRRIMERFSFVHMNSLATKYTVQRQVDEQTRLSLTTDFSRTHNPYTRKFITVGTFAGTIRHQFSPRVTLKATARPLQNPALDLKATYQADHGSISVGTTLLLNQLTAFLPPLYPPLNLEISRLLSAERPLHGVINLSTGPSPEFSMDLVSPSFFDWRPAPALSEGPEEEMLKPALLSSGPPLLVGTAYRSVGFAISGLSTHLKTEMGVRFEELALHLKTVLQLGFTGLAALVGGVWTPAPGSEVATFVGLGASGVYLKLDFMYMGQRLTIPINLSDEFDPGLAFWTAVVPSSAYALGYYYILRPRRLEQRRRIIRQARRAAQDQESEGRREYEAMQAMLKDVANRHMQAETRRDGLVILEATYGADEVDEEAAGLSIDVTIPLQALVNNSQLFIPSRGSKASLQGFYDPCPLLPKVLRIRYMFGGRMHYAEIPDGVPVAIPLEDHLVE
ncbi:DnaJ-domain-containing protein [Gloeophyllum trabeum ATCC 11539]|uniref:DnaJ-domain-containing protein n=1 Tax=Gloeophyllum trabeum (strain ATCC 11539 / FP-39264 / Madison 617) TaxID=670483 RepID=S7Q253_GLOTA|nr:DnaJ-domain-containing protein [Gloeophyllum trabeum ATCC 11539]EPQ53643.1 DnaJ-domain-containing protein [Gloeophyllum trabeum ATCC 11539]